MSSAVRSATRYPAAERQFLVELIHDTEVSDPYRWLEDPNTPASQAWLTAQQELYQAVSPLWADRDRMADELGRLLCIGYSSAPLRRGGRLFHLQQEPGRDRPVLMVSESGHERVLLDPNTIEPDRGTMLDSWMPSWQGDLVAVQLSTGGTEESRLWILEVATGRFLDGPIDRLRRSSIGWLPDGSGFYYVRRLPPELHPGEERYHRRVYLHRVGTPAEADVLIFGEGRDKTQFYGVSVNPAGPWLVVTAASGTNPHRDLWIAELAEDRVARPALRLVQGGVAAHTSAYLSASSSDSRRLYLRTDLGAPRGRIMIADLDHLDRDWVELVGEDPEAVLEDLAIMDGPDRLLASWRRHGGSELTLHELSTGRCLGRPELPGFGVVNALVGSPEAPAEVVFNYVDPRTPPSVLHFDGWTGRVSTWRSPINAPDVTDVHVRRLGYRSADGTEVRMFVLAPTSEPDRPRPAILTGYGGFGSVMAPDFRPEALAWARAGGVYAVACLRGGGEEGAAWHRAGTGTGKQNVFDDFHAAADQLVAAGYTRPDLLGILGASNGGLLVGAALTQHPEKYAAAACIAPLLDMVRYENSGMGPSWRDEYGSVADPAHFANLLRYSPYHAVREGVAYPAVMLAIFEGDTRVDPLHARKMCAALQQADAGERPIVLRIEQGVGHGARPVSSGIGLLADCLGFFAHELGLAAAG